MKRFIRLCLFTVVLGMFMLSVGQAEKPKRTVPAGAVAADSVLIFQKDTTYVINQAINIKGALIIEPGTEIVFYDNGRLIIAAGGRLIADGFAQASVKNGNNQNPLTLFPQETGGYGYADMRWFLYPYYAGNASTQSWKPSGIDELNRRERTVNPAKLNHIFNVAIDSATRKIINIADPYNGRWPNTANTVNTNSPAGQFNDYVYKSNTEYSNIVIVPFETALMFRAARLEKDPKLNPTLMTQAWARNSTGTGSVNIVPETIVFRGNPQQTITSREWGHIVVMPGARAAYFRNCSFENFKKDTTVDRTNYYSTATTPTFLGGNLPYDLNASDLNSLNKQILSMTNGGGGAITTFASRTWVVNCKFKNNFARNRGGALQVYQSPTRFYYPSGEINYKDTLNIPRYNKNKNARIIDPNSDSSSIMARHTAYPAIDRIDENAAEYTGFNSDTKRIPWDDGRVAMFLGRFRNLEFDSNMVRIAVTDTIKAADGKNITADRLDTIADYPLSWGNMAYGGAIYIAGISEDEHREIEFGLGINDSINMSSDVDNPIYVNPNNLDGMTNGRDYFKAMKNNAVNLQNNKSTDGAKGGAIYVGSNSSLIIAGEFDNNKTDAKYLVNTEVFNNGFSTPYFNGVTYSLGGAIYGNCEAKGRLQVRGDKNKEKFSLASTKTTGGMSYTDVANFTTFSSNRAGAGGAIYIDKSEDEIMSPVIGGSDYKVFNNGFGYRISFKNNYAYSAGGAVYTKRNTQITGSGGVHNSRDYSYDLPNIVQFDSNAAGYAGGALHIEIPTTIDETNKKPYIRIANTIRTAFNGNTVGENADTFLLNEIRGGGAIYTLNADLNVVKATSFDANAVFNGNGGAVVSAAPYSQNTRMFLTDLDSVVYQTLPVGTPYGVQPVGIKYVSKNYPFVFGPNYSESIGLGEQGLRDSITPTTTMLTRFNNNATIVDKKIVDFQSENYGNTQMSKGYVMPVANFYDQWWVNQSTGFLAGSSGYLVKVTKNNKNQWNWQNINVGDDHSYTAIQFATATVGYLGDNYGNIRKTEDGGATWDVMVYETKSDDIVDRINDINWTSGQGIAVTQAGRILTTFDGNTWNKYTKEYDNSLKGATWTNNGVGYVVGTRGMILKTYDNGVSWKEQYVAGLTSDLNKVLFTSTKNGYAVGNKGAFVYTIDGGESWEILTGQFPTNENLTAISFYGSKDGYVASSTGEIYKTIDAGQTWTALKQANGKTINSLYFFDPKYGFATSNNTLVRYTEDSSATWNTLLPANEAGQMGNTHLHANIPGLVENGVGLGGAIYILDEQNLERATRTDSVQFNRVRFTDNYAVSGSVIYSDNYGLKLIMNRSLVTGNTTDTNNVIGREQNAITGPYNKNGSYSEQNLASSDLVATTVYGELAGPLSNGPAPNSSMFSSTANSIYGNQARFLIRLPDAPNTKGVLAGQSSVGLGGTVSLVGNYWGKTEANVVLDVLNLHDNHSGGHVGNTTFETFFIAYGDDNYLPFYYNQDDPTQPNPDYRKQGPFEWNSSDYQGTRGNLYKYTPIVLANSATDVNQAASLTIPEKYLFSSGVYDLYDKGTDIKTADYSKRRMVPIEDFAVGNPVILTKYIDPYDTRSNLEKKEKYVKRWVRDPQYADAMIDEKTYENPELHAMQSMWRPMYSEDTQVDGIPRYYHPLPMPLFLEATVDLSGDYVKSNWDLNHQTETVFFVINETTTDYIRVTLKQDTNKSNPNVWDRTSFRARVEFVPDSTERRGETTLRRASEGLENLGSDGTFPFGSDGDAGAGGSASAALLKKLCPRELDNTILQASRNEDYAALTGRKYIVQSREASAGRYNYLLGGIDPPTAPYWYSLYSNRPSMPTDNRVMVSGKTEYNNGYFAGERFRALPVNKGDVVRVVSRNVLWKEGVEKAYDGGLVFVITDGPEPPVFTGDIVTLKTDSLNPYLKDNTGAFPPIYTDPQPKKDGGYNSGGVVKTELLNKIFLRTNREYPAVDGTYSNSSLSDYLRGTDTILRITAIDRNNFYDPRATMFSNEYTDLTYTWSVDANSGLRRWLMADTVKAGQTTPTDIVDGARGYVVLKGVPLNPYIVPGGEPVKITATNYPPGIRMIDSLRKAGVSEDTIKMYYQTFPEYFNTPFYYGVNADNPSPSDTMARFLQQDTLGFNPSTMTTRADDIYIYVGDSLPRFIAYQPDNTILPDSFKIKEADNSNKYVELPYDWTYYQAGVNANGKIIANLTDSLRFRIDVNTDDELEDSSAVDKGWDFRYGRTAYSFANLAISAGDTMIVDTMYNKAGAQVLSQLKPVWMDSKYFVDYETPRKDLTPDISFQKRGQMNIRIDSLEALGLLKITAPDANRDVYNTDTMFAMVANDGHGGLSTKLMDVIINFQPVIVTETLPDATEQMEYNPHLDTIKRRIFITDANANQKHEFELLYPGPVGSVTLTGRTDDSLYIDPFFKVGGMLLTSMKTTPTWLKIYKESGLLYGTPDLLNDYKDTVVTVTVLVKDEDGLFAIKQLQLKVIPQPNAPTISVAPISDCLVSGQTINDSLFVTDKDLLRNGDASKLEQLTLSVEYPSGLYIEPAVINGPQTKDTIVAMLKSNGPFTFNPSDVVDGRLEVKVKVVDKTGLGDSLVFKVRVSEDVDFISKLTVMNNNGAYGELFWGTAKDATTGWGDDGHPEGMLDVQYCEVEIPNRPVQDAFDTRWQVGDLQGTYRNIYPTGKDTSDFKAYKGVVQAGGENTGNTSKYWPVRLKWDPNTVPSRTDANNPAHSTWTLIDGRSYGSYFRVNMRDTAIRSMSGSAYFQKNSDGTVEVVITDEKIDAFHIYHDWTGTGINETDNETLSGISVYPNPANNQESVSIGFEVEKAGNVTIDIFNDLGEKVATVVDAYYNAGPNNVTYTLRDYKGTRLSSGAYRIQINSGMTVKTAQLIVLN